MKKLLAAFEKGKVEVRPRISGQVQIRIPKNGGEEIVVNLKPHARTNLSKYGTIQELRASQTLKMAVLNRRIEVV